MRCHGTTQSGDHCKRECFLLKCGEFYYCKDHEHQWLPILNQKLRQEKIQRENQQKLKQQTHFMSNSFTLALRLYMCTSVPNCQHIIKCTIHHLTNPCEKSTVAGYNDFINMLSCICVYGLTTNMSGIRGLIRQHYSTHEMGQPITFNTVMNIIPELNMCVNMNIEQKSTLVNSWTLADCIAEQLKKNYQL